MEQWVENRAGFLIALSLHVLLFSWMITHSMQFINPSPRTRDIVINVQRMPTLMPEPAAATRAQSPASQAVEQSPSKTTVESVPEPLLLNAIEPVVDVAQALSEPAAITNRIEQLKELTIRDRLQAEREQLRKQQQESQDRLEDLSIKIDKAEIQTAGLEHLPETLGSPTGAVRTFNLLGQEKVVEAVLRRYHIRVVLKNVPEGPHFNYLNQANTSQGSFYNSGGTGLQLVLAIPAEALAHLSYLETQAIRQHGLDLNKTRIVEVVFGIVYTGKEYDLVVTDLEYDELD